MSARLAVFTLGLALFSSAAASAQTTPPQSASLQSAEKFLDESGQSADFDYYINLLAPVVVESMRSQRSNISEACGKAITNVLRNAMAANVPQVKRAAANAYASRFSDTELDQLSVFFSSDLGKKYRQALADIVRDGVKQPGAGKPFVEGVLKAMDDQAQTTAGERMVVVLKSLKGRMSEREIGRLATFFYNGVGQKYMELTPAVSTEIARAETDSVVANVKPAMEQMLTSGTCS